ncbi:MAG: aldehyde dehydrogenase family protein [Pirellulales bacterium]
MFPTNRILKTKDYQQPVACSVDQIDSAIDELTKGAKSLEASSIDHRIALAKQCLLGVARVADDWVVAGCKAKKSGDTGPGIAEEYIGGPIAVLRFLHLTIATLEDIRSKGNPCLPGSSKTVDGQLRVPVFPTKQLYDALAFMGLRAECWLEPGQTEDSMFGDSPLRLARKVPVHSKVELVLGAGNVSAIPITDALTKIFHQDHVVLLKMNPVNEYLGPIFEDALKPIIDAGWLRIIYGDATVGRHATYHPGVNCVHITGSVDTHEAIVWGSDLAERSQRKAQNNPLLSKPISSELGNVTPWIVIPGEFTPKQLIAQVESVAASIINNASFNCIATKMIITHRDWPQRKLFLSLLRELLEKTPVRYGYYPGAADRHHQFSGMNLVDVAGKLPWVLKTDLTLENDLQMFERESFVCVVGECNLEADGPVEFLNKAVALANEKMTGTLAAAVTVPDEFAETHAGELDQAIQNLRYGTIGVNQWPALGFAWMSPPWGGYPGASLEDVQSGIGSVHNTFLLSKTQKTVIYGKLTLFPKPVWFSTHACPEWVAYKLFKLYASPSVLRLPGLFLAALRG